MAEKVLTNEQLHEVSSHAQVAGFRIKTFLTGDLAAKIDSDDIPSIMRRLYTMSDRVAGHTPVTNFSYALLNGSHPERLDLCAVMISGTDPKIIISQVNAEKI